MQYLINQTLILVRYLYSYCNNSDIIMGYCYESEWELYTKTCVVDWRGIIMVTIKQDFL